MISIFCDVFTFRLKTFLIIKSVNQLQKAIISQLSKA